MNPATFLITGLVDSSKFVPVITKIVEFQFIKEPISIFVQGFQFENGIITNITGNANLGLICKNYDQYV